MMRSFVLGCLLLLALTAGTARASLLSGFKGLDSMKESLAVAADELEVELRKAQETFQAGKPSLSLSLPFGPTLDAPPPEKKLTANLSFLVNRSPKVAGFLTTQRDSQTTGADIFL